MLMLEQLKKISYLGLDVGIEEINIRQRIIIANWFAFINLLCIAAITVLRLSFEGINLSILVPADNIPFLLLFLVIKKGTLKNDFIIHFFGYMFTVILFLNLTIINLFYYEMFSNADLLFAKFSFTGALIQALVLIPIGNKKIFIAVILINSFLFLLHDYFYHHVYIKYADDSSLAIIQSNFNFVVNFSYFVVGGMVITFLKIINNYQIHLSDVNNNLKLKNLLSDEQNKNLKEQNLMITKQSDEIRKKNVELNTIVDDLHKLRFQLNDIINSKDKFISILAHDLKNGLFGLVISLEGLIKSTNNDFEKNKRRLISIHKASINLSNLLENILNWAGFQLGNMTTNPKFFNINELIEIVVKQIYSDFERKQLKIIIEKKHKKQLFADFNLMQAVLRNLLMNAIKYSQVGSEIKIVTSEDESYQYLSVIDQGVGIDIVNQSKIFKIEEKFSLPGTSKEQGTGFGLILSKEYIELNNGEIFFKSSLGQGTTFTIKMHIIKNSNLIKP